MSSPYYEKLERQKALCQLLKQVVLLPEEDTKREHAIDAIVLTIDQLNPKDRLAAHQHKYYDSAIEFTQRDVKKNIGKFFSIYNLNILEISDRDPKQLAKLEKCFINWILIILKKDCIDEYYKTEKGKEKKRQKREKKLGRKIKRRASQNSKYVEISLNKPTGYNNGEDINTIEQMLGNDLEGKTIGEVNKGTHSLSAIDSLIAKEQAKQKPLAEWVKEYREEDSDNKLKNLHPRGQKQCNCQVLLELYEELSTMDEVYERLRHTGCKPGTIRNWLTRHKSEKSQNRKSCMNLMLQIIQEEYYY